jgi:hypothetical protein
MKDEFDFDSIKFIPGVNRGLLKLIVYLPFFADRYLVYLGPVRFQVIEYRFNRGEEQFYGLEKS